MSRPPRKPLPDPAGLLPLSAPVFHILLTLSDSETHGYGIIVKIRELTDGELTLSTSTLYGAIKRMMRDQLIEESDLRPAPEVDDERRRYYRISSFGRRVLGLEARRIKRLGRLLRQKRLFADDGQE